MTEHPRVPKGVIRGILDIENGDTATVTDLKDALDHD